MGAPKLTDANIEKAVLVLDGWAGNLIWDRYLVILELEIGHKYTKAAMLRQPRIKAAWDLAKARARESAPAIGHGDVALTLSAKRIEQLEDRVERLQKENNQLLEQFVRWAHNAVRHGLALKDLDRPLPVSIRKETK